MNRMLRQVVSWQPLRSCPRTRGRGRVLRYCEICWCGWVGCQGIVGCFMFWCGGGSVSCGVVGWSVLYWEEGGRRVRSDHCQLIRPSTHKCIWLFSVRFVSNITFQRFIPIFNNISHCTVWSHIRNIYPEFKSNSKQQSWSGCGNVRKWKFWTCPTFLISGC